uniref:(northern house mosquito) hypothetical protein n=1 Tax=Culex pipiens TaxID=7175 RepID=A0A8D8B6E0_CULPI
MDSHGWWSTKPVRTGPNHSIVVDHIETAGVGGVSYANTRMTNASIGHIPEPVGRTNIKRSRIPNSNEISIMDLFERKRSKLVGWYLLRLPHPRQSVQNKTDSHTMEEPTDCFSWWPTEPIRTGPIIPSLRIRSTQSAL